MKLYAPSYYTKFRCIAHRCEHSCCIGWEIDIDSDTMDKYSRLKDPYASSITDSISTDGTAHFVLRENDACPHLDERGLCRIICNVGQEYLCDICREHPRFYNYTDVAEVGLGMSCREAARIILSSPEYDRMQVVGEVCGEEFLGEFDARAQREKIYAILRDESVEYLARLSRITEKYSIDMGEDERWREKLGALEYLDPSHRQMLIDWSSDVRALWADEYLERALAYFIYRHCTEAYDMDDLRHRLTLCILCERLLAYLINREGANTLNDVAVLASIISEEIEYCEENTEALMY